MNGCEVQELEPVSLVSRLLGRRRRGNAIREVNNVLASQPIYQIYHDGIEAILRGYRITLADARDELIDLYTVVLRYFGQAGELTPKDADQLDRLRILFGLDETTVAAINERELAKLQQTSKASS